MRYLSLLALLCLSFYAADCQATDIDWVLIKGSSFTMGGKNDCNQQPEHEVTISSFFVSKFEVTVRQYRRYCDVTGRKMPQQPQWSGGEDWPVVMVSWKEAADFAEWAGARLPTEAEWEFAVSDGKGQSRFSGSDDAGIVSWNVLNSNKSAHAVGSKKPNANGLYDMTGNVSEWCSDWYSSSYYKISAVKDPVGPDTGFHRVVRGGSWFNKPGNMYNALRYNIGPNYRYDDLGFRIVKR